MNIQCDNCGAEHDLDPPAWVLSSGRPFRFRCSVCGHSQMAEPPTAVELDNATEGDTTPFGGDRQAPKKELEAALSENKPPGPGDETRPRPTTVPTPESGGSTEDDSVFLKQDGKVYLVKDWATLQRWIMERRVGREDLVSEGGVRWEPIGSRPELGSFFAAVEQLEAAELAGLRGNETPFPTDGNASGWAFDDPGDEEGGPSGLARLDDETEGVPIGMPPLPTEDLEGGPEESPYPDAPPSRLEAASASPEPVTTVPVPVEEDTDPPEPEAPAVQSEVSDDDADDEEEPDAGSDHASFASTVPYVDPTPSMPLFSEGDDDTPSSLPPAHMHDTPVFGGREVADLSSAEDDEPLIDPFAEPGVSPQAIPDLGDTAASEPAALAPDDEWQDSPADEDDLAPTVADADDEDSGEDDRDEITDEFDADDPFRDFEEAPPLDEPVVQSGTPAWLPLLAAAVLTIAAILLLVVGAQNGWFSGAPVEEPATLAETPEPPVPQTPATVVEPPTETDSQGDTDAADTDAADTDAADTDVADPDAADTDATADDQDPTDPDDASAATDDDDPSTDVEPDTAASTAATPPPTTPPPTRTPPANPTRSLKNRGWAAMDNGRMSEAEDAFRRALQTGARDAEAHLGLGVTLLQQGRTDSAKSSLCQAAQLGNRDIQRQANGMLEQAGLACGG